jgi:hypothetical protein
MQLPPLDPEVTDTAPTSIALTAYDKNTSSRTSGCSTWTLKVPTGVTSHE